MASNSTGTASAPIVIREDSEADVHSTPRPADASHPLPSKPAQPPRPEHGRLDKRQRKPKPPPEPIRLNELHAPWLDCIPSSSRTSSERMLHEEIAAYQAYMAPTAAERTLREHVTHRLTATIKGRLRDARVYTYGSSATGLSLPNGDIDMVLQSGSADDEQGNKSKLFQLRSALTRDGIAAQAFVVTRARHLVMNIEGPTHCPYKADISINSLDGVDAVALINDYAVRMPALRPLVMVLKGLLGLHKLGSAASSGLSSYATISMVINFLQVNPYELPHASIDDPSANHSLGTLLLQFLQYYATDFPYETSYISVRESAVLLKESKTFHPPRQHSDALVIECMVNPDVDIARAASRMKQVRELFAETRQTLQEGLVAVQTAIDAGVLSGSVLKKVLGVSQELLDYRARIAQLIASRQHLRNDTPQARYNSYPSNVGASAPRGGSNSRSLQDRIGGYSGSSSGSSYRSYDSRDDRGRYPHQGGHYSGGYSGGYSGYGHR
ncbi:Nucleotidyltransferase [Peniophora sp. CONT]|nr:Nucleotidyltransferase [Peniophora sp. CONT]